MSESAGSSGAATSAEAKAFVTGPSRAVEDVVAEHDLLDLEEHRSEVALKQLALDNQQMRIELVGRWGKWVLIGTGVQVLIADSAFFVYGCRNDWRIPVAAIDGWLSATVVQVIAVALVIAKSLFPENDRKWRV